MGVLRLKWTNRKGEERNLCIDWGKHNGACGDPKTVAAPIFTGDNVNISLRGKNFKSEEMFLMVDKANTYAGVSDIATELAFEASCKSDIEIVKLEEIVFSNSDTEERISAASLISLLSMNDDNDDDTSKCGCGS